MKETILIVDDTPENLMVISEVLLNAGFNIKVAEDGPSAIAVAEQETLDLILLDIMMPGMDGYETCRHLMRQENTRKTPILFMTALSALSDKVKGFAAGGVDYITKPYQQEEVLARVNTHLTLSRQKRELENLLEERHRFMRMAIHDFRNPLSAIIGWAELGNLSESIDEAKFTFKKVHESANWLNDIINDFLALHNMGKQKKQPAVYDLKQLTHGVADQHRFQAAKKDIEIELTSPESDATAFGVAADTHQILSNYLSNAIKYSPNNSKVQIRIRWRDGKWRVEVQDQGPGIPEDERELLFQEFARISTITTADETSTRLGLAIVKRLATSQGADVGACFPESGGSVFWYEIPTSPK